MEKRTRGFKSYLTDDQAGVNISWGAVFAGVITFLAMFMTLSLISSAIGFGTLKLTTSNPLEGVGTGLMIWTIIMLVLSFLSAGFVAGIAAKRIGLLHGFLTWATSMLVIVLLVSFTTVSAFSAVGSLLGNVASGVGSGVQTVASGTSDVIVAGFDKVTDKMDTVDTQELQGNLDKYLKDTDVPELQPDYLKDQLKDASDTIVDAGKEVAKDPDNADQIFDSTADKLQDRAKKIGDSVDKHAIANSVAKNSDLSQEEAQQVTDNIYNQLQTASKETQKQIDNARDNLEQAKDDLKESIDDARKAADDAADAAAKASLWGFAAMMIGLIITSLAGLWGSNLVKNPEREVKM
jgi:TM2 domain-containing membrane protein YozV/polyhydroxyalkanoate synthesis regulator phasin